ncbi:MAG: hypothetical protein JST48_10885 [Bacteroidetes bacterium]|nr:hypothetical protein [Bacteroidota bacterium]
MKRFSPILFASALTASLFMSAYLKLNSYYSPYGIDIKQWIEWDEWIPQNFDGFIELLLKLFIIISFGIIMLEFEDNAAKTIDKSKKKLKLRLRIASYVILILIAALMVYYTAFVLNENMYFKVVDVALAAVPLIVLGLFLTMKNQLQEITDFFTNERIILIIAISTILLHPIIYADKQVYKIQKENIMTSVQLKDEKLDSLIYLGSTKNQYFLYSKKKSTTYILRKDSVAKISMQLHSSKLIIR